MKKAFAWITKGSVFSFRFFYALAAIGIIIVTSFILGHEFLTRGFWGTDLKSAIAIAAWVDKYFPNLPFWYPQAGGGVSITHSYPTFAFWLVSVLKRLSHLNLVESFSVIGFASVPLMALGIYTFVSLRFKNQTAAFLAAFFYLISPLAWVWLVDWGFYSEAVAHMFVMPAIIFWDLFFTSFIKSSSSFGLKERFYLLLTVIFLVLIFLTHFGAGMGVISLFVFYILGYTIKEKARKKVFVRGVFALLLVAFLTLMLTFFTTFPFYRYGKIAATRGVGRERTLEQIRELVSLSPLHVLNLKPNVTKLGALEATRHISFPVAVSFMVILGLLFSFKNGRSLTLGLFAVFALALSINAYFIFWVMKYLPWPFYAPFTWRWVFVPLRMVWPTLGALGILGIFQLALFWIKGRVGNFLKGIFISLAGIVVAFFILYQWGYLPKSESYRFNYGGRGVSLNNIWNKRSRLDICLSENQYLYVGDEEELVMFRNQHGNWCSSALRSYFLPTKVQSWCELEKKEERSLPNLCYPDQLTKEEVKSFWQQCRKNDKQSPLCDFRFKSLGEQLAFSNWPDRKLFSEVKILPWFDQLLKDISRENPRARIDFSLKNPAMAMLSPYYNLDRNLSQLYIYTVRTSSLINRFRGQQVNAFYVDDPFYGSSPIFINNLTHWFGIDHIIGGEGENLELFEKAGWEIQEIIDEEGKRVKENILKFQEKNSLAEASSRPTVLQIGQNKLGAYDQAFLLSAFGVLPYKDYWLVWGKENVDSYSLDELQNFDVLLLHGYTYKNRQRADKLLAEYVKGGGSLFIDTGWEYGTPDWETKEGQLALEVLPFDKLFWKDLGKLSNFVLEEETIGGGVDASFFASLIYEGQSWKVSTGERSDLKNWTRVVLSTQNYPLVVMGELGEGRVVWSGMNLVNHAKQGENIYDEEIRLLNNIFTWLSKGKEAQNYAVSYDRNNPDKVEFTIKDSMSSGGFLLWKEAHHPDFQATINTNRKLETYRAGPSMTLIKLPELKAGEKVIYQYQKPISEKVALAVSLLTLVFLPALVIEGVIFKKASFLNRLLQAADDKLHFLFFKLWKKPFEWWKREDEDE